MLGCLSLEDPPDTYRTLEQIISSKGYPVERHEVVTEDGYRLGMFRIPYGRDGKKVQRPVAFLQHGLIDCAFTWCVNFPSQSLSYILADAGYDVWIGDTRGNYFANTSTKVATDTTAFWDGVIWTKMAQYDMPAQIGYALNATRQPSLSYIGHSEGTTVMFAALVRGAPQLADMVNVFIALGPVITVSHETNTAMRILADIDLGQFLHYFGERQFTTRFTGEAAKLFEEVCEVCGECCADAIELLCGRHQGAFNNSRMPVVVAHEPGGTSVRNMELWAQMVRTGKFQEFDYGSAAANMEHYGQPTPPAYDISKMPPTVPVTLISGGRDELADPQDVRLLHDALAKVLPHSMLTWMQIPDYAHLDFVWATDANQRVYPTVLYELSKYNPVS